MVRQISMRDLHGRVSNLEPDEVVLDVRTVAEYRTAHIAGSLNIPHDELPSRINELRRYRQIYVHCRSGRRAEVASQTLLKAGVENLVCVAGSGMDDWIAAGLPVESSKRTGENSR